MMIFNINNVALKDQTIAAQQMQIETLRHEVQGKDKTIAAQQIQIETLQQEVQGKENEIGTLQKKMEALEKKFFPYAIQKGSVDRILIEKKARRLMLISKGEVLKPTR